MGYVSPIMRYRGNPIYSRHDAENANREGGQYFFEPDTMRFFSSRISDTFHLCEARRESYFVTSEQNKRFTDRPMARKYTVRAISWDTGKVRDVSGFQVYDTSPAAQRAAKAYANGTKAEPEKEGVA